MLKTLLRKPSPTKTLPSSGPVVDFPRPSEKILPGQYTLRIAAPDGARVEVSIDQGPWTPCRSSVGYWWFDWSGFSAGRHEAVARIVSKDGTVTLSKKRSFHVLASPSPNGYSNN